MALAIAGDSCEITADRLQKATETRAGEGAMPEVKPFGLFRFCV